jgi:hypothetical protein
MAGRPDNRDSIPFGDRYIPLRHRVRTGYTTDPASDPINTVGFSSRLKRPECDANQSRPSNDISERSEPYRKEKKAHIGM